MAEFIEGETGPAPHGHPVTRSLPKCATEYAVRLRQWFPADSERHGDQFFKASSLDGAEMLAGFLELDAAEKAPQTRCEVCVVARVVTEWIEIDEEADRASAAPAG